MSKRSGKKEQNLSPQTPPWWGLVFNLTLALGLGMGSGLVQAGRVAIPCHPQAVALVSAGAVGLLVGLISRLSLRNWIGALRFLSALLALLLWMAMAEIAYAVGAGLQSPEYLAGFDTWVKTGQLTIGCLSILAIGLAGQRRREKAALRESSARNPTSTGTPMRWGLSLSLILAIVLGLSAGFVQANADRLLSILPPLVVPLTGAGVMGVLVGLTARLTLRGRTETLKALLALAALLLWIVAAEVAYAVWNGLRPLSYLAEADNGVEMGQIAIGTMAAVVGGVIRRPPVPVEVVAVSRRRRKAGSPARKARKPRPAAQAAREQPRKSLRSRLALRAHPRHQPEPADNGNGSEVKVIAKEQDRCPYCLDVIEAHDPRGVVVCEICGTPHHADCWAVAGGRCQMPHLIT